MKKKFTSKTSLIVKLKPMFISVVMTLHAILASFLGGAVAPMLACDPTA